MQRACCLGIRSLTCRDAAPGTKHKGSLSRAAQAHSKGRTCGVHSGAHARAAEPFLLTKIVKNHATVGASTRSSRSNSPENGGEALQEAQQQRLPTEQGSWTRIAPTTCRGLTVVVKCPPELVHASVFVERFCVLQDRPCFRSSPFQRSRPLLAF